MKNTIISIVSSIVAFSITLFVSLLFFMDGLLEVVGITTIMGIILSICLGIYIAKREINTESLIKKAFKISIICSIILCLIMSIIGGYIDKSNDRSYSYIEQGGIRTYEKDYYFDY